MSSQRPLLQQLAKGQLHDPAERVEIIGLEAVGNLAVAVPDVLALVRDVADVEPKLRVPGPTLLRKEVVNAYEEADVELEERREIEVAGRNARKAPRTALIPAVDADPVPEITDATVEIAGEARSPASSHGVAVEQVEGR